MGAAEVRFADVEAALRDAELLAWLLPLIDGKGLPAEECTRRTAALNAGITAGLTGRDLVQYARGGCPT